LKSPRRWPITCSIVAFFPAKDGKMERRGTGKAVTRSVGVRTETELKLHCTGLGLINIRSKQVHIRSNRSAVSFSAAFWVPLLVSDLVFYSAFCHLCIFHGTIQRLRLRSQNLEWQAAQAHCKLSTVMRLGQLGDGDGESPARWRRSDLLWNIKITQDPTTRG